jgi:DNA-binding CsgD family transcriptional regulator
MVVDTINRHMDLAPIKTKIWQRRQDIAGHWQASLAEFNHNYPLSLSQFTTLVEDFITALFETPVDEEKAYALGADFVQSHHIHPDVLMRTQTILLQELSSELCPEDLKTVQSRLIQAYNHFFAGYGELAYSRLINSQAKEIERLTALQSQATLLSFKQDASWFSLVEQVSNPVVFHDGKHILDANLAAHTLLAFLSPPLKEKPILTIFAPWAQKSLEQVVQTTVIMPYETSLAPHLASDPAIYFYNISLHYQQKDSFALIIHTPSPKKQQQEPSPDTFFLTNRETQILQLIAADHNDKTIAEILEIEPPTVKFHLGNIRKKFGVSSRAALIHKAWQYGLLDA